jgi:hypothetical protein
MRMMKDRRSKSMPASDKDFQHELHIEFLKALHDEKTKTQGERTTYITSKFAFITGLFGLGALRIGEVNFGWLLYFIPLVAIGYDLYIRAADLSIKKMGAFLRNQSKSGTAEIEKDWESFAARYRDKLAQLATTLFTFFLIIAAAVYIYAQQGDLRSSDFWVIFSSWFLVSLLTNVWLWKSHRHQIKKLDALKQ